MSRDRLDGISDYYDVVVIGSGLAGMTAANRLARGGLAVLLLEQHYNYGGMATWFQAQRAATSSTSRCTAFPFGMIKTCRKYWTDEIADSIVQLKNIRFDNPQFTLETTFDRADFTRQLTESASASSRPPWTISSTPPGRWTSTTISR
jgi:all-trans-retinol 13,14-reductase